MSLLTSYVHIDEKKLTKTDIIVNSRDSAAMSFNIADLEHRPCHQNVAQTHHKGSAVQNII